MTARDKANQTQKTRYKYHLTDKDLESRCSFKKDLMTGYLFKKDIFKSFDIQLPN